jgi:hypothetical protein
MAASEYRCVCDFIAGFERLLPEERARAAGEVASFLIGYAEDERVAWRDGLDLDCEEAGHTQQSADALIEMLDAYHVLPSEDLKKRGASPPKGMA